MCDESTESAQRSASKAEYLAGYYRAYLPIVTAGSGLLIIGILLVNYLLRDSPAVIGEPTARVIILAAIGGAVSSIGFRAGMAYASLRYRPAQIGRVAGILVGFLTLAGLGYYGLFAQSAYPSIKLLVPFMLMALVALQALLLASPGVSSWIFKYANRDWLAVFFSINLLFYVIFAVGNYLVASQHEAVLTGGRVQLLSSSECGATPERAECWSTERNAGLLPLWVVADAFPYGKPTETLLWKQPAYFSSTLIAWLLLIVKISMGLTLVELVKDLVKRFRNW